jgi:hypothetical protein
VGTSPDGQDVVNSGEIQTTQRSVASFPAGQLLYATIWVKHANAWWPTRTTFSVASGASSWVAPSSSTLPAGQSLQWTPVSGAQAYYLWVGTSPMTQNVVNSGEMAGTSYPSTSLPRGVQLYATIWTKSAGVWSPASVTFTIP